MGSAAMCKCKTGTPKYLMGVDEAGRGPLLGPVYAAAVVLSRDGSDCIFKDSKKYSSEAAIKKAAQEVRKCALVVGLGSASVEEIDKYNIRCATHLAMHRAIAKAFSDANDELTFENTLLAIDGSDFRPYTQRVGDCITCVEHQCFIKGDDRVPEISAASIIAKATRDSIIHSICNVDPCLDEIYGIRKNKGYGTAKHITAIKQHGITPYHRKTFRPCLAYKAMHN